MVSKRPFSTITSGYIATHPDTTKPQGRYVQLSADAKRRYEAKGWVFKRATSNPTYLG
jgi:hypothetical protein